MADAFKTVTISPLNGILDLRTPADQIAPGAFSWKQNFQISPDGKLQQANGFVRAYANQVPISAHGVPCPYLNWDFHDQSVATNDDREPPTLLFYSTANDGKRQLYLGTKTRLFVLDETTGNWTALTGEGPFGQDSTDNLTAIRFKAAQLQNNLYFINGYDDGLYYTDITGTTLSRVDLSTSGSAASGSNQSTPITKPKVIIQWSGVMMMMNMEEGGVRRASRIRWSDLNDGTFWLTGVTNPSTSLTSIADYQDLDYGEAILAAIPLLGYLYVLTDKAIWRCGFTVDNTLTTATATLQCQRIYYEPRNQSRCLAFPNTLVSDGDSIYYAGRDAIYKYNPYLANPERTEWIYRGSSIVFDEGISGLVIDPTSCQAPVAEYWPDRKEIHFSWPTPDAVFVGEPSCDIVPPLVSSGINTKTLVMNTEWQTCDYRDYGMTCYANFTSNISAGNQCNQKMMFLGALSGDYCLKELGIGYARQVYDPVSDAYSSSGYLPLLRMVLPLGQFDKDKQIKQFLPDGFIDDGLTNLLRLRVGISHTVMPVNYSIGKCGVVWRTFSAKPATCLYSMSAGEYAANNLRPAKDNAWNFLVRGRFFYVELSITDQSGNAPKTGGITFTRFEVKAIIA